MKNDKTNNKTIKYLIIGFVLKTSGRSHLQPITLYSMKNVLKWRYSGTKSSINRGGRKNGQILNEIHLSYFLQSTAKTLNQ